MLVRSLSTGMGDKKVLVKKLAFVIFPNEDLVWNSRVWNSIISIAMYFSRSWFNSNLALVFFFVAEALAVLATFVYLIYTYIN